MANVVASKFAKLLTASNLVFRQRELVVQVGYDLLQVKMVEKERKAEK